MLDPQSAMRMPSNNANVIFKILVLAGAVVLGTLLTATFAPEAIARADGLFKKNDLDHQRGTIDLQAYPSLHRAQTNAAIAKIEEDTWAEHARNLQDLEQRQQRFVQTLKQEAEQATFQSVGMIAFVIIAEATGAMLLIFWVRAKFQENKSARAENNRLREFYQLVSDFKTSLRAVENQTAQAQGDSAQFAIGLDGLKTAFIALEHSVVELKNRQDRIIAEQDQIEAMLEDLQRKTVPARPFRTASTKIRDAQFVTRQHDG